MYAVPADRCGSECPNPWNSKGIVPFHSTYYNEGHFISMHHHSTFLDDSDSVSFLLVVGFVYSHHMVITNS